MSDLIEQRQEAGEPVAAYKRLLKRYIDRRPSGTRQRIAAALGTHKSFVSQVTNPNYRVPLPAQHLATIMRICHFSPEEEHAFLSAYRSAHPGQAGEAHAPEETGRYVLQIEVPAFKDPKRQKEVIEAIREMAARMVMLARNHEP